MKQAVITLMSIILMITACASPPASEPAPPHPASTRDLNANLAQPIPAHEPENVIPVTPEPTREFMTERTINAFSVRITDLTYLSAIGRIAEQSPELLPLHIAATKNHDTCLSTTYQDAELLSSPARPLPETNHDYSPEAMADALAQCLRQGAHTWDGQNHSHRAIWLEHILAAATRARSPAEHYKTIHPQPYDNERWVEMANAYGQCNSLTIPYAESIAVLEDPPTVTRAITAAVTEIDHCMAAVTEKWPEFTEQPNEFPPTPGTSTPGSLPTPDPSPTP